MKAPYDLLFTPIALTNSPTFMPPLLSRLLILRRIWSQFWSILWRRGSSSLISIGVASWGMSRALRLLGFAVVAYTVVVLEDCELDMLRVIVLLLTVTTGLLVASVGLGLFRIALMLVTARGCLGFTVVSGGMVAVVNYEFLDC